MNDGDTALVIQDDVIINVAERNMKGVVPLYYEMKSAKPSKIEPEIIYKSLTAAYKANIGIISNDITKIWNSYDPNDDAVKWLTMENNFTIDYSKTLFMIERPKHIDQMIKVYTNEKLPYFFKYAKDKTEDQVNKDHKDVGSINKLRELIKNPNVSIEDVKGKFKYTYLMRNPKISESKDNKKIIDRFKGLILTKRKVMNNEDNKGDKTFFNKHVREEMLKVNSDELQTVDLLIKHHYNVKDVDIMRDIWNIYGDVLYGNLKVNIGDYTIQCERCGETTPKTTSTKKYCDDCGKKVKQEQKNEWKRKNRKNCEK